MHNLTKEQIFKNWSEEKYLNSEEEPSQSKYLDLIQAAFNFGWKIGEERGYEQGFREGRELGYERGQNDVRAENAKYRSF